METTPARTRSPAIPALVAQAQAGDRRAFEALYREQVGRIYALCLRMTGNRAAAEELTQQAFVRAWEKLGSFRGESAFSSWLHRLAVNQVLSDKRSQGRRLLRIVPVEDPAALAQGGTRSSAGTVLDLEQAIALLPPRARTVFVLHDVQGYSHPEVAEAMGITVGTSKGQLHRARKLLREALAS